MKRKWARLWIKDLETTKAKQGRGALKNADGGYCCLGRLCIVAGLKPDRYGYFMNEKHYLPPNLVEIVGMSGSIGALPHSDSLAKMNDAGASFKEIAKVIRKHWREL